MKSKNLDLLGISAASLCLIHCLVFPLLLILPLSITHNAYIDLAFLAVGAFVVYRVAGQTGLKWVKSLLWGSIALIAVSVWLDLLYHMHTPLIYIGAAGLISGHIINFKHHKHG